MESRVEETEVAKRKDYQLQECPGICVRAGRAIQQNKIPVIEMLSITRHNGDIAETEREIRREGNNHRSPSFHAVVNMSYSGPVPGATAPTPCQLILGRSSRPDPGQPPFPF
ncbi:hypothetical protein KUCAC02_020915 [Chaenocephalus aceratus]|uniref:Uncharacterized protein n=1 Tax=Chaenocephalus aceratus TaxID=36190 RepID=A0ACB9XDW2_CHAAC|nr:hypothetical protein KUCAC02_020915 [Chaenocephalus aceratus]